MTGLALACAVAGLSYWHHDREVRKHPGGVVVASEVSARQGDGYIYQPALTNVLHSGAEFAMIERRGDWLYARFDNGEQGWLPLESVALVDEG
ncbi:MAG: hypothetical protein ACC661_03910, partial [Verrucomicrobiales bacterium]